MLKVKSITEDIWNIEKPVVEEWCKAHNVEYRNIVAVVGGDFLRRRIYRVVTADHGTTERTDVPYMMCFFGRPDKAKMFVYQKLEGDDK